MTNLRYLLEQAQTAAIQAGKAIMKVYRSGRIQTRIKKDQTPFTIADQNSHNIILDILSKTGLPVLSEEGEGIAYDDRKNWEYFWLIDPLDGTREFINKINEFTVNIALIHDCAPIGGIIYVPPTEVSYCGWETVGVYKNEKGKLIWFPPLKKRKKFQELARRNQLTVIASRSHFTSETRNYVRQFQNVTVISSGSSLKFMQLLENRADIYPRLGHTMEWDTAAAHAILNMSNRGIYQMDLSSELIYNKENLKNPFFVAF